MVAFRPCPEILINNRASVRCALTREAWFLLNIAVMASLATIDESVAEVVAITSVSLVLVLLGFVIVVYHTYCVLCNTGHWVKLHYLCSIYHFVIVTEFWNKPTLVHGIGSLTLVPLVSHQNLRNII